MPTAQPKLPDGLRVLLAEDEPLIAMDGEATLLGMGVQEVVIVRSLADGLAAADSRKFDLAFLDFRLGADTSLDLAKRLADLGVPFAFLTGYQGDAIPAEHRSRPVVAKPFSPQALQQALHTLAAARP